MIPLFFTLIKPPLFMTHIMIDVFVTLKIKRDHIILTYCMPHHCKQEVVLNARKMRANGVTSWQRLCEFSRDRVRKLFNGRQGAQVLCVNAFELNAFTLQEEFEATFKFHDIEDDTQ